jgi:hypothetical protein
MQGDYRRCLETLDAAEQRLVTASYYDDELGNILYGRAVAFHKMQSWPAALKAADDAGDAYRRHGNHDGVIRSRFIRACILFDRACTHGNSNDILAAKTAFLSLRRALSAPKHAQVLARLWLCLAACDVERRDATNAGQWLQLADSAFRHYSMDTELVRAQWCRGRLLLITGQRGIGIAELRSALRAFENRGMPADAAFVGLDLLKEMVAAGESRAECVAVAERVAGFFRDAGLPAVAVSAVNYLARALAAGKAQPRMVCDVRRFVQRSAAYPEERFAQRGAGR